MFQIFIAILFTLRTHSFIILCQISRKTNLLGPKPLFGDGSKGIIVIHEDTIVYMCRKAVAMNGSCVYSLCRDCFSEKYPKKRGSGPARWKEEKSPLEISRNTCCHNTGDLKDDKNLWWCEIKNIGSKEWFSRCHGCFGCEKMFVQVSKKGLPPNFVYPHISTFDQAVREEYEEWNKNNKRLQF